MNKKLIIPAVAITTVLFTALAINHTNTTLATENSPIVSEESTTEEDFESSSVYDIQPTSDKSPKTKQ